MITFIVSNAQEGEIYNVNMLKEEIRYFQLAYLVSICNAICYSLPQFKSALTANSNIPNNDQILLIGPPPFKRMDTLV